MNELKGTISILIGLQNIIYATTITTSSMIIHYLRTKCPGAQTLLDLIAMDTCFSQMAFLTAWVCIINLGHFNGQANYQVAEMLLATGVIMLEWMLANCQSYIMVNAVLIFKAEWVNDLPDEAFLMITRAFVIIYTLTAKFLDASKSQNPKALEYMTGRDEASIFGPSLGLLLQMVICLVTLIAFQIFKPTELAEKRRLFFKLIGCVIAVLICTIFVINMNEDPNADLHDSEEFFFLAAYMAVQIIIGLALPGVFITSYRSLEKFFRRLISILFHRKVAMIQENCKA